MFTNPFDFALHLELLGSPSVFFRAVPGPATRWRRRALVVATLVLERVRFNLNCLTFKAFRHLDPWVFRDASGRISH